LPFFNWQSFPYGGHDNMEKARDIMTGALITCAPDDSVADAARLMRDRNTGDVLVAQDGKLLGIVTDRDIAVRQTAAAKDSREVAVRDVMSTHVVTGQAHWDLDKIAAIMGEHQIRRLPIMDDGLLVGIVSLGDLALRDRRLEHAGKSLKKISEPATIHNMHSRRRGWFLATLGVGFAAAVVVATRLRQMSWDHTPVDEFRI
jgi:CBS domain-containing protein